MKTPRIAITLGDPAGVGPETIVGAWRDASLHAACQLLAVGQPELLRRAARLLDAPLRIVEVESPEEAVSDAETLCCLPCGSSDALHVPPARVDARGGQAAYDALREAARLALDGRVDAVTTAPLNKAALAAAGHDFPGHTELLAHLCGVPEVAMMLYLDRGGPVRGRAGLGVAHVTLHTAMRDVFDQLTEERIVSVAHLTARAMTALIDEPDGPPARLGVCALNPHAGEQGLFGCEESRIIQPAVLRGRREGLTLDGPLPADTLLGRAVDGDYDGVVAMYHDQGHIALKLLGMHRAVNITLGLPIIRTSVAHGTAFDLAWRGQANWSSMVEAIRVAARLVGRRPQFVRPPQHAEQQPG